MSAGGEARSVGGRRPDGPPFLLWPRYVAKPWGGRRLEADLARTGLPPGPLGESWEAADLPAFTSVVEGGPLAGSTLRDAWGGPFPLLVKILDAREHLSVQVHPRDGDGPHAKEEAWVALAPGASVALGTVDPRTLPAPGAWLERLDRRSLEPARGALPPTLVPVPAGTVHAVLAGSLLWEVQTPVEVTWRLDDHRRVGLDGRPRALHVEEARGVLGQGPEPGGRLSADGRRLEGLRLWVEARPPGRWEDPPGEVAFLPDGGDVLHEGESGVLATLEVPRARTVVLSDRVRALRSPGWTLLAGATRPGVGGGREVLSGALAGE